VMLGIILELIWELLEMLVQLMLIKFMEPPW